MCHLRKVAGMLGVLTCASLLTLAQSSEEVVKVDVSLVSINVAVTNPRGRHVPGLTESDFQVKDRGTRVPLEFFDRQGPASIVFVVDISSSMTGDRWKTLSCAIKKMLLTGQNNYRYSLVCFSDRARLVAFDVPANELWMRFSELHPYGDTALYDGVILGLETVHRCQQRQKALVILSDGADNKSVSKLEDVRDAAFTVKASIYPVGILLRDSTEKIVEWDLPGKKILSELAESTGAIASFPRDFMMTNVLKGILNDISSRYTLSYYTPDDATGWRDVQVAVTTNAQLRLRYQNRYRKE